MAKRKQDLVIPIGYEVVREPVKGSMDRAHRNVFCRSGDFVWKYRKKLYTEAQYYAGERFAAVWERAGMGEPKSIDWAKVPAPRGSYRGLPDPVCDAMTEVRQMCQTLGKLVTHRLLDHLVHRMTVAETAEKWGFSERAMGAVLSSDLDAAADYFGFKQRAA